MIILKCRHPQLDGFIKKHQGKRITNDGDSSFAYQFGSLFVTFCPQHNAIDSMAIFEVQFGGLLAVHTDNQLSGERENFMSALREAGFEVFGNVPPLQRGG